jgi:hypothetical protein
VECVKEQEMLESFKERQKQCFKPPSLPRDTCQSDRLPFPKTVDNDHSDVQMKSTYLNQLTTK